MGLRIVRTTYIPILWVYQTLMIFKNLLICIPHLIQIFQKLFECKRGADRDTNFPIYNNATDTSRPKY